MINKTLLGCFLIITIGISGTEFYKSRVWLNALYYEQTSSGYVSLADSSEFFIFKNGKNDPKNEYIESLKLVESQNKEFKTKFPYRYKLIAKQNNISYQPVIKTNDISKAIIAFPNRYMANPASMFGHLFVILKSKNGLMDSNIVHFLANTANSNPNAYIYNGITGKFKGWYLLEPYYSKVKEYNYVEDREINYYELDLTKDAMKNMQLHTIELKQTHFDYYFLDENCATSPQNSLTTSTKKHYETDTTNLPLSS